MPQTQGQKVEGSLLAIAEQPLEVQPLWRPAKMTMEIMWFQLEAVKLSMPPSAQPLPLGITP